jgi:hypothetical protein
MKKRFCLNGVEITVNAKKKTDALSVVDWLNVKIEEFTDEHEAEGKTEARKIAEFFEIVGALKFAHMAGIITLNDRLKIAHSLRKTFEK